MPQRFLLVLRISIHAPRTGSDVCAGTWRMLGLLISIHAPRTGSDFLPLPALARATHFNPRSPHGERPPRSSVARFQPCHFNPRSPHGERRFWRNGGRRRGDFNPRSPHGERRAAVEAIFSPFADFNPRSPHGERRRRWKLFFLHLLISIHAPRTGSDKGYVLIAIKNALFQSTLPARGATTIYCSTLSLSEFQSTLPARGATITG